MNDAVRARLVDGGADRLADLFLDSLLARPIRELLDLEALAPQVASALRDAADDPQVEAFFRARLIDVRARVPAGPVALPDGLRDALDQGLRRPYVPDRELLGKILDHDAVRRMLEDLFRELLLSFVRRVRPPVPPVSLPVFGRLGRLGDGVLGTIGHELEAQLEQRAREFADVGIGKLVGKMADLLCDPARTGEYAAWRAHTADVLLRADARVLAAEVDKLDVEALVATAASAIRALARRDAFADEVRGALRAVIDEAGDRSAREILGGIEAHALGVLRGVARARARAMVDEPAFVAWWDEVVEGSYTHDSR